MLYLDVFSMEDEVMYDQDLVRTVANKDQWKPVFELSNYIFNNHLFMIHVVEGFTE